MLGPVSAQLTRLWEKSPDHSGQFKVDGKVGVVGIGIAISSPSHLWPPDTHFFSKMYRVALLSMFYHMHVCGLSFHFQHRSNPKA